MISFGYPFSPSPRLRRLAWSVLAILAAGSAAEAGPAPVNVHPTNTAADVSIHPTLEIDHDDPTVIAAHYQVASSPDFLSPEYDSGETLNDLFSHVVREDLAGLTLFHWRARVKTSVGVWSDWSLSTSFGTIDAALLGSFAFRGGVNGYAGAADTDLRGSALNPLVAIREWNQGAQDVFRLGRRPPGSATDEIYRTLLRFDLSEFDPGDPVINAYIELTGWEHDDTVVSTRPVGLFEVYRPWGEGDGTTGDEPIAGESSWTYSEFPQEWGLPGCADAVDDDPLADRAATPLVRLSARNEVGHKTYWSSAALTAAVQRWILDPDQNRGLLLRCADETLRRVVNLASREHPDESFRPRLLIETAMEPPNEPPSASTDAARTRANVPVDIDVLANDADPDSSPSPLELLDVADPPNGTATIHLGLVRYEPDPGFVGLDSFTYTIGDGEDVDTGNIRVLVSHFETIEAETAALTAPMTVATDDPIASGGAHVIVPPGSGDVFNPALSAGEAAITFTVPVSSKYAIWARARAVTRFRDAFFVSVDGAPFTKWTTPGLPLKSIRNEVPYEPPGALTQNGDPRWIMPLDDPLAVDGLAPWVWGAVHSKPPIVLAAGVHTIRFRHLNDGTLLDCVLVTNDLEFTP